MRFAIVLVLIVAVVCAVGYSRGWFHFASSSRADQPSVTMTVDKDKIRQDKNKAVDKVENLGAKAKDAVTTPKATE